MAWTAPAFPQAVEGFSGGRSPKVHKQPWVSPSQPGARAWRERRDRDRRHRRHRDDDYVIGLGYDYGDYDFYRHRDSGFFRGEGRATQLADGSARYDYDRGYPYDHFSGHYRGEFADYGPAGYAEAPRCRVEWTRDAQSRRDVQVRICSR